MEMTLERVRFSDDPRQIERVRDLASRLRGLFRGASVSSVYQLFTAWSLEFMATGKMPEEAVALQGLMRGQRGEGFRGQSEATNSRVTTYDEQKASRTCGTPPERADPLSPRRRPLRPFSSANRREACLRRQGRGQGSVVVCRVRG